MTTVPPKRTFEFKECLGKGGFGEVYRATMANPSGLKQDVAVKVLHAKFAPGSDAVSRLRDEGRLMAALRHPNILRVIDIVALDGRSSLITEYLEGADLDQLVRDKDHPLPIRVALEILAGAARALESVWNGAHPVTGAPLRLVHRDIKPANIRVGPHGDVKVLDFGIARTDNMEREAETESHMVLGSLPYLSPEACVSPDLTVKADIFALGCTLFEVLSGERMTTGKAPAAVYSLLSLPSLFEDHREARAALLPEDDALRALVAEMTSFDLDDRPGPTEVADRCEDLAAQRVNEPSLSRWARAHSWPPAPSGAGELTGQTVHDTFAGSESLHGGTLPVSQPIDEPEGASRIGRAAGVGVGVSAMVLVMLTVVCAGGALIFELGQPGSVNTSLPEEAGGTATSGASTDPSPPEAAPAEGGTAAPHQPLTLGIKGTAGHDGAAGATAPAGKEGGTPSSTSTKPAKAPASATPKSPTGASAAGTESPSPTPTVSSTAAASPPPPTPAAPTAAERAAAERAADPPTRAQLKKVVFIKDGTEYQPGNVPPGEYELMTDFGSGLKSDGTVTVEPGQSVDVACSSRRQTCWVK